MAVCVDIKNAFNTIPWTEIMRAVENARLPPDILRILRSYLKDRRVCITVGDEGRSIDLSRGVPQGSVLEPTLWNLAYKVLEESLAAEDTQTVCYADDTIVLTRGRTPKEAARKSTKATRIVIRSIESLGVGIAKDKTEAVLFSGKRTSHQHMRIRVKGIEIEPKRSMKYLGIELDDKLTFVEHMKKATEKSHEVIQQLARLMPNTGGPKQKRRKLLARVGESIMTYGAQIWGSRINTQVKKNLIRKINRSCAQRVTSAYRTILQEAVEVLARMPPLELIAQGRAKEWENIKARAQEPQPHWETTIANVLRNSLEKRLRKEDKQETKAWIGGEWQARWDSNVTRGQWTKRLIPNIGKWTDRSHGQITYHLKQAISGHGAFNAYLKRFGKRRSAKYNYCENHSEDAEHVLFNCESWTPARTKHCSTGRPLTPDNLIGEMLTSTDRWRRITGMITEILKQKEEDDRKAGF